MIPNKQRYPIKDSPFFRINNVRVLERLLGLQRGQLSKGRINNELVYDTFLKITGTKERKIEAPKRRTKSCHTRLLKLLQRIETPSYLYSGVRGISYIDNARKHLHHPYMCTLDIKSFYPSCKKHHISAMFKAIFETSSEIAATLSNLVTIDGHLPTGSPVSQILGYFTFKTVFDEINQLCASHGVVFSLYVDDMTFSSSQIITTQFIDNIRVILLKNGLRINNSKTQFYGPEDYKRVTGVILHSSAPLKLPNKQHKKIIDGFEELKSGKAIKPDETIRSIRGMIHAARQIEPDIFPSILEYIDNYYFDK